MKFIKIYKIKRAEIYKFTRARFGQHIIQQSLKQRIYKSEMREVVREFINFTGRISDNKV